MEISKYQRESRKTAVYPRGLSGLVYLALGLAGEAGEVSEKFKKAIRDDRGRFTAARKEEISKELGDVLWYLANISSELGLRLDDVARMNLKKLRDRMKRGKLKGSGDNR